MFYFLLESSKKLQKSIFTEFWTHFNINCFEKLSSAREITTNKYGYLVIALKFFQNIILDILKPKNGIFQINVYSKTI